MFGSCTQCHSEDQLTPYKNHFFCDSCYIEMTEKEFCFNFEEAESTPTSSVGKVRMRNHRIYLFRTDPICKLCSKVIKNWEEASIDHIIPRSKGGSNDYENLQLAHKSCNNQKGDQI